MLSQILIIAVSDQIMIALIQNNNDYQLHDYTHIYIPPSIVSEIKMGFWGQNKLAK